MIMNQHSEMGKENDFSVRRLGGRFLVVADSESTEVYRDDQGVFRCECSDFEPKAASGERCVHLLSVRKALVNKESELFIDENVKSSPVRENVINFSRELKVSASHKTAHLNSEDTDIPSQLDRKHSDWCFEVKDLRFEKEKIFVIGILTINGVSREGLGSGDIGAPDGVEVAEKTALASAASKFNAAFSNRSVEREKCLTGLDLVSENPMAESMSDLVTASQLQIIRSIGAQFRIDPDIECRTRLFCSPGELSRTAASKFIEYLKNIEFNAPVAAQVRMAG